MIVLSAQLNMYNSDPFTPPKATSYIICALALAGLPIFVVLLTNAQLETGKLLRVSSEISLLDDTGPANVLQFNTSINTIQTSQLTGEKRFVIGDQVFVFFSAGPNDIWYPYALTKRPPRASCYVESCLFMTGIVSSVSLEQIQINYNFETFYPRNDIFKRALSFSSDDKLDITLAVGNSGRGLIRSLNFNAETFDQRNMLKFAPPGFSNLGDNKAPATNPPK